MENVIQELVKIESHAKEITRETEEKRKNIDSLIENRIEEIQNKIDTRLSKEIQKINQTAIKDAESKIQEIKENTQKQIDLLNKEYESNHIDIEKSLFDFIIKV